MLEDVALDVCALAVEAYQLPEVKDAAKVMGFGENQSMVRTLLAIEIAHQYQGGRSRLKDQVGRCCP